ncbi:MAG: hypothetical protein ACJ75B_13040 [Flavisolibacter sp.]
MTNSKNDKIEVIYGECEKFAAKILKLNNYSSTKEPKIPIDTFESILSYIDKKYGFIQLDNNDPVLASGVLIQHKGHNFICTVAHSREYEDKAIGVLTGH